MNADNKTQQGVPNMGTGTLPVAVIIRPGPSYVHQCYVSPGLNCVLSFLQWFNFFNCNVFFITFYFICSIYFLFASFYFSFSFLLHFFKTLCMFPSVGVDVSSFACVLTHLYFYICIVSEAHLHLSATVVYHQWNKRKKKRKTTALNAKS